MKAISRRRSEIIQVFVIPIDTETYTFANTYKVIDGLIVWSLENKSNYKVIERRVDACTR